MALFDEIISRMIQATGAKNQQEMLETMGFSAGLASKWKKRGNVPDGSIAKVAGVAGVTFHWLKTGEGEMRPSQVAGHSDPAVQALVEDELTGTETTLQLTGRELRLIRLFRGATPDRQQRLYDLATEAYLVSKEEEKG